MGFRVRGLLRFPESPAGVGSRLEALRGVWVDPRCPRGLLKPAPADRVLHRKNRGIRLLGSKILCVFDVFMHFYVKTRWFFVIFMAGALPRAGVVAGGLAAQQATSWLPAGHLPAASRLQPATIQCRIIILGRCRGWRGWQPPAEGRTVVVYAISSDPGCADYTLPHMGFRVRGLLRFSRKPYGRGFPFRGPPGCGGGPALSDTSPQGCSGGSCFTSQKSWYAASRVKKPMFLTYLCAFT